ncbi:MAG: T9SS type A sorting domain-containing protein [bacterium]|nr:T9SS type A sorting domain-containing protein [bacterium]
MRSNLLLFVLSFGSTILAAPATRSTELPGPVSKDQILFIENKGQVSDQDHKPRPDILFSGSAQGLVYHLRNDGISYQLSHIDSWKVTEDTRLKTKIKSIDQYSIYRLDLNWLNANTKAAIKKEERREGYNNYYLPQCPHGVLQVRSYGQLTYLNIYTGIDLKWYEKQGQLKYDYLVAAGADYHNIQLEIKGAENIYINYMGDLVMKTPFGDIIEQAPVVTQAGKTLRSKWILNGNRVSYDIEKINTALPFIIDPGVRVWGTYLGGTGGERAWACSTNTLGDIFMAGYTTSTGTVMATSGAHQGTYAGGTYDAFLSKFNAAGMLQWCTYYGGAGYDDATGCSATAQGDVFIAGMTSSTLNIATIGAHQPSYGGGAQDGFLVKFDGAGVRQWATYYGDAGNEWVFACSTNSLGDVFMVGSSNTATGTVLASSAGHQPANGGGIADGFLAKFDAGGIRQWGTYYGGTGAEEIYAVCTATTGDVFITGWTSTTVSAVMTTPGAHQTTYPGTGSFKAFLAKFNGNGIRQWGTYYGGNSNEFSNSCAVDAQGNVFICGSTQSTIGIATPGAWQTTKGSSSSSNSDAYLAKFNPAGVRQWGTYYGSTGSEVSRACSTRSNGDVFMGGSTDNTITAITTPGAWQVNPGGGGDIFIIGFNAGGTCLWSSYYGSPNYEEVFGMTVDPQDKLIFAGASWGSTGTVVVSASAYQTVFGGSTDALLVKFEECTSPSAPLAGPNQSLCAGSTATVTATTGTGSIQWFASAHYSATALGTGTAYTTGTLSAGVQTLYAGAFTCGASQTRAAVVVSVFPNPVISVNSGSICAGQSFTILASGAATYTYPGGSNIVTPANTAAYSVTGTSSAGCPSSNTAVSTVTVRALPVITANSGTTCSGSSFTIVVSGASTYTYSGGSGVVAPVVTSTYAVTGSAAGCVGSNTAVATVSVMPLPVITATASKTVLCSNALETVTLNASGADTYTWIPAGTGSIMVVSPGVSSVYSVTGTNAMGCRNYTTLAVSVIPPPAITASGTNTFLCEGVLEAVTLNVSGASTYTWVPGGTGSSIVVTPSVTSIYSVTGTNAMGCKNQTTLTVVVDQCTGLTALTGDKFQVYPNPFSNRLNIEGCKGCAVQIFDELGRPVHKQYEIKETEVLDLSKLSPGIYFLQVRNDHFKLLKE